MTLPEDGNGSRADPSPPRRKANNNKPNDMDSDPCPVCSQPSISACRNCTKVSYCGKAHQRLHWKEHKGECHPLLFSHDPVLGSRLIATRNIKPGEIVWREKPLLVGPKHPRGNELQKETGHVCLGCNVPTLEKASFCPTCSWPLCSETCPGREIHELNECKILEREQVSFTPTNYMYGVVFLLRALLLKLKKDAPVWEKVEEFARNANLEGESEVVEGEVLSGGFNQFALEFMTKLNLSGVTSPNLQTLVSVLPFTLNSDQDEWERRADHKASSYLYLSACQSRNTCLPNCGWWIVESSGELVVRALSPIQFGRVAGLAKVSVSGEIGERLQRVPDCCCDRCSDPSELGTFYSAIKCPTCQEKGESPNCLLPILPLGKRELRWKCHGCGTYKDMEFYTQLMKPIKEVVKKLLSGGEGETETVELEKFSEQTSTFSLHANHAILLRLELEILKSLAGQLFGPYSSGKEWSEGWRVGLGRYGRLCRKWLEVGDVLWPGLSKERGTLLYYYQKSLTMELLLDISKRMRSPEPPLLSPPSPQLPDDLTISQEEMEGMQELLGSLVEKQFLKLLSIRQTISHIFCFHPKGTEGHRIALELSRRSPEIEILKLYVFGNRKEEKPVS